ncbi:hypothetical protein ESY86_12430 [Subsaximicrobium wynnwilliamsii]|jgi:hypothetical protein|uniref:DUF3278 domain-containing protein n=1 Tax=Subsaximicrobium wynnwilliamsii TaxID=291179 RepID=A0A5C6ZH73_9FLAO|nr:hypothetical protein [Subsaximicrobium wynnwilliamsii]TXD82817.1 hypothetical protein ESY87_12465 [Subsaximicrobium wynnwilliamsii]TXD88540.1 hypothetical protein ESY86_12430 [Subsaximicrobium wynnwilliamsii]TXE02463.1 hypothetical protein ESY88_11935 [Subsaximicrobium wynnwilliamsii]
MKLYHAKAPDNFQKQLQTFKALLKGSMMAKTSSFMLIAVSLVLAYKSRDNMLNVLLLLTGMASVVFYIIKHLSLQEIKQKSYTQRSLMSSISKFKAYMANRKKYEIYFLGFWIISLIPYATSFLDSKLHAILFAILYIAVVTVLGNLAYKKIDKIIAHLESELQSIQ